MGLPRRLKWRRSSLRGNRRGVSPIIATILLVAITVALAATLYVLLIPFITHATTTPIGSAITWDKSAPTTGGSGNPGCHLNHYCWYVTISYVSGSVAPSSMMLYVQGTSGLTISNSSWTFTFQTTSNPPTVSAQAPGPTAGASATPWAGNGTSSPLPYTMQLWIDTGYPTSFAGETVYLVTSGTGGFTGSFSIPLST